MAIPQRFAPPIDELRGFYVGKHVDDVPKPAVILDSSKIKRHCQSLSKACSVLGVDFRCHTKTHKTREATRLQVGGSSKDVRLIGSTIAEFEHLLPLLEEFQSTGRSVNMLYGIPLLRSQVRRLASIGRQLGPGTISVLIDHASQLDHLKDFASTAGFPAGVYVKIDTGYHRAGLPPTGANKNNLLTDLMQLETAGQAEFIGLYSHSSLSYNGSTPQEAIKHLEGEIDGCLNALNHNASLFPTGKEITISVGASPQVTSVENLLTTSPEGNSLRKDVDRLRETIQRVNSDQTAGFRTRLELHAGVYSILDVQQMATHARGSILGDYEDEIAISVVAEVCSVYNDGERQQPEALVAVGTLGLGREPPMTAKGWGTLHRGKYDASNSKSRLVVDRISQEHCIVAWDDTDEQSTLPPIPLEVGQSIQIFPNHACITGALYGWYLVIDSSSGDDQRIIDVWIRASGW